MRLVIQLLGPPQFQLDDVPVTASRRAVAALLAYLAVTDFEHPGQRSSRESLADLFWTDYDPAKALSNLRHTLWEVTQFIGDGWVIAEHETIYLNPRADVTLDVTQFQSLLSQAARLSDPALQIPLLEEAVHLYRADFLSGFLLRDGSEFNEWVLAQGEVLRQGFASALEMLVEDYAGLNEPLPAIPYAQRLVTLDPLRESAHRKLMHLFAMTDQQPAALQQYKALERLLRKELNLDPQPETRELYKKIRKGDIKPVSTEKKIPALQETGPKHNLPFHLSIFVGRERERHEVAELLARNRLVTLIGAGGIGKTRLAIEAGHQLLERFPDGVWFVPLESLLDEDLVPQAVASSLNIAELPDQALLETLSKELRRRHLLLILDNCEHLLKACAQLAETLLKNCPGLRILATSREALRLEGEVFYHVPTLAIPRQPATQTIDELAQYEAVRLFVERASLVGSDFELTTENAESVVKICERLDGIPLAIELAAAHVDIFSVAEILSQLNRSFSLLASDTRSTLLRHQTMHTSIDWGWNLLAEPERVFTRRLSVFLGGWTLLAAQAVGVNHSRELTSALVKKSFVIVHQQTRQETRFGFHEVVRSYAQEKLREAGEEESIRNAHLEYFLELAKQLEAALHGPNQDLWLDRLFVERDNIRAALEWAAITNVRSGLFISNRLRAFWESYDRREEARWLLMI